MKHKGINEIVYIFRNVVLCLKPYDLFTWREDLTRDIWLKMNHSTLESSRLLCNKIKRIQQISVWHEMPLCAYLMGFCPLLWRMLFLLHQGRTFKYRTLYLHPKRYKARFISWLVCVTRLVQTKILTGIFWNWNFGSINFVRCDKWMIIGQ